MKNLVKLSAFAVLASITVHPVQAVDKKVGRLEHHLTHAATGFCAYVAAIASGVAGVGTAIAFNEQGAHGLAAVSAITGTLVAGSILYKTPQWTDSYILGYDKPRSTSRNIITFLCRGFLPLPYPFGIVIGELGAEKDLAVA